MLKEFLRVNEIKGKLHTFKRPVTRVEDANGELKALGKTISKSHIAKSILFLADEKPVLVVVLGSQRVSEEKVKKVLHAKEIEMATPEEVEDMTGFEVGGVPPIGVYGVPTLISKEVVKAKGLFCGGGDEYTLLEVDGDVIEQVAFEGKVADVVE